ncbi:MAG: aminoacyl-tRNA hydrolase [Solirubrobacteraceae bacterium]|nr:aminoacyl-tRNA hydrolase [Solirubrobacteraceae bacterium]
MRLGGTPPADWLLVGLGNPGAQYARTRHNVGWMVLDELERRWDLKRDRKVRFKSQVAEGRTMPGGPRVALLWPQTFMNLIGEAASPARGAYKVEVDHVLAIHDEIDLKFGDLRARLGGGLAGHNGLKSMKAQLGTPDFGRIRIGVSRPDSTDPEIVSAWVLGKFSEPPAEVAKLVSDAADLVESVIDGRTTLEAGGQRRR